MSDPIEYQEGDHSDFIIYLFNQDPKPRNTIALESPPLDPNKHLSLHIFEQLLMIFVDGLRFLYSDDQQKVDINSLTESNFSLMKSYFHSMNYDIIIDIFETMYDYKFKYPNYFKNQEHITPSTSLYDLYYEIFGHHNRVFRVSFATLS